MECSPEFSRLNFEAWNIPHPTVVGRTIPTMNMTKDGFVFLVMGFTGLRAAQFKEAYITRFNEMEAGAAQVLVPALPDFSTPALAAWSWVSLQCRLPPT